jgi:hypothetical protein
MLSINPPNLQRIISKAFRLKLAHTPIATQYSDIVQPYAKRLDTGFAYYLKTLI